VAPACGFGELAQQAQWAIYLVAGAVSGVLRVMAASQIIHAKLRSHDAMMRTECAESKPSVPATQPSATYASDSRSEQQKHPAGKVTPAPSQGSVNRMVESFQCAVTHNQGVTKQRTDGLFRRTCRACFAYGAPAVTESRKRRGSSLRERGLWIGCH
jgi:hypothetical protein